LPTEAATPEQCAAPTVTNIRADDQDSDDAIVLFDAVLAFDASDVTRDASPQPEAADSPVPAHAKSLDAVSSDDEDDEDGLVVVAPGTSLGKRVAKARGEEPVALAATAAPAARVEDSEEDGGDWDAAAVPSARPTAPPPVIAVAEEAPAPHGIAPDDEWARFGGALALGGAADDGGLPALSCSSCGFAVLRFRGCCWSSGGGADYMHFRNYNGHSLNLPKLTAQLRRSPGGVGAAYACQCSWQSVVARKLLDAWGTDPSPEGGAANGSLRWQKLKAPPKAA
jgi:hypothetical protein